MNSQDVAGKTCTVCRLELGADKFYLKRSRRTGKLFARQPCRECHAKAGRQRYELSTSSPELERNSKRRYRNHALQVKYGITIDKYDEMVMEQKNKCAICLRSPERNFGVDHCHESGAVRGLLCITCNAGLGSFKDSIVLLKSAIKYLDEHRVKHLDDAEFPI